MCHCNGRSYEIWSFFLLVYLFALVSFIFTFLPFECNEQCYSWEQHQLTTHRRMHAWNGYILFLWILLNRAKLKTKHGLIILRRTETVSGKTCKFQPVHIIIPKCLCQPMWSVNPSTSPASQPNTFLFLDGSNKVLIMTYFHYFTVSESCNYFGSAFAKTITKFPTNLVFYNLS